MTISDAGEMVSILKNRFIQKQKRGEKMRIRLQAELETISCYNPALHTLLDAIQSNHNLGFPNISMVIEMGKSFG